MVEVLGKDIPTENIAEDVKLWHERSNRPIRPEVLSAILSFTVELVMPSIFEEDDEIYNKPNWFKNGERHERYLEIVEGLEPNEKNMVQRAGQTIAFGLARRILSESGKYTL